MEDDRNVSNPFDPQHSLVWVPGSLKSRFLGRDPVPCSDSEQSVVKEFHVGSLTEASRLVAFGYGQDVSIRHKKSIRLVRGIEAPSSLTS